MRIVYIILAHTNYEQTMRLFSRLNKEDTSFVFHISKTSDPQYFEEVFAAIKDQPNCYFAKRAVVRWGDFGVNQGALNAIGTILDNQIDFDFAILLSGQSYPLKSHATICRVLEEYQGKQLLENIPFSEIEKDRAHRIEPYYFWLGNRNFRHPHQGRRNKLLVTLLDFLMSPFIPKRQPLPPGYTLYKGSLWWTLTKDCIEYIQQHSRTEDGQNLIKFLKNTRHSGETYFQTVLMNSDYKESIVNKDLRYILWLDPKVDKRGHPKILTVQNFDAIVSTECLFGRKFDMEKDAEILDLIDEHILAPSDS